MDEVKEFKKEQDDWTRLYYKTLKRLEAMIGIQKQIQDMMKRDKYNNNRNGGHNSKG